ncbi:hypothetical protein [Streptomyces phytophilus]|uniref:hypothetical protein n=1 Tax=Streptomyces phytophilus TaxID=722715 RepID=UPI0015F0A550|nr:hypothetical protein [Streptomyces phytophilus]
MLVQPVADGAGWVVTATDLDRRNGTISQLVTVNVTVSGIGLLVLAVDAVRDARLLAPDRGGHGLAVLP